MRHRLRRLRPPVSRLLLRLALRAPTPSLPLASRGRKPDRIEEGSRPPPSARRATGPESPATPPRAALAGTGHVGPAGMRSAPYGARRPQQPGARLGGEGRTKGRADRSRGSAHVDGVKAMRARATAPSPPVRLPAGRAGVGAAPHGPDRARRPRGRQAPLEAGDVSGPAAGRVRPYRPAPRSRLLE